MPPPAPRPCDDGSKGTLTLPLYKSGLTQEEVRVTALSWRYITHAAKPTASWKSSPPPRMPFSGILDLQGSSMQYSSPNPYSHREIPAEQYARVKEHVEYMRNHPYEKTLKYKIDQIRDASRSFISRTKCKLILNGRMVFARLSGRGRKTRSLYSRG